VGRRLKYLAGKRDLRKTFPVPKFLEEYQSAFEHSTQENGKIRVPFQSILKEEGRVSHDFKALTL
jgi:hypothetical protein